MLKNPRLNLKIEEIILDRLNDLLLADIVEGLRVKIMTNEYILSRTFGFIHLPMAMAYRRQAEGVGKLEKIMKKAKCPHNRLAIMS